MCAFLNVILINNNDFKKMKDDHYNAEASGLEFRNPTFIIAHPQLKN